MNILYIGDIMGEPGIEVVQSQLGSLKQEHDVDFVIAQAENVTDGKSMSLIDMKKLQDSGVDFFTGGNHTPKKASLHARLKDPDSPVIGPVNMAESPGQGWKIVGTDKGKVLVISLLGNTVGKEIETRNPLQAIDQVLALTQDEPRVATIVNFHGDYSSEKVIIGHYLDGRVTAVIGDHWHVPTADARVLPKGTAHMTDVGMCGVLNSSLGVTLESVVPRWRDGIQTQNAMAEGKPYQFNAVLVRVDERSGLAKDIKPLRRIID